MNEQATEQAFTLPTPGAEHERLKPFEGTFKSEVKMWMDPSADPMISTGTMKSEFQLNGLYLHQDYQGDATEGPFPNFAGKGYWGYNPTSGKYEGFWIDTAASMFQNETGNVDGNVWEMHSTMVCPSTGQEMAKRSVITLIDDDHHKMEMYFTVEGNEMKCMEINYERA